MSFYCSYFPGKRYCHRRRSLCFSSVEKVLVGKEVVGGFCRVLVGLVGVVGVVGFVGVIGFGLLILKRYCYA